MLPRLPLHVLASHLPLLLHLSVVLPALLSFDADLRDGPDRQFLLVCLGDVVLDDVNYLMFFVFDPVNQLFQFLVLLVYFLDFVVPLEVEQHNLLPESLFPQFNIDVLLLVILLYFLADLGLHVSPDFLNLNYLEQLFLLLDLVLELLLLLHFVAALGLEQAQELALVVLHFGKEFLLVGDVLLQ